MLMPVLSVTVVGIVAALVGIVRGRSPAAVLLRALLGAWLGFAAGALPGVLIDVVLGTGGYLALLGHVGAIAGAAVAVIRAPAGAPTHGTPG